MNSASEEHLTVTVAALRFSLVLEVQAWGLPGGLSKASRELA